MIAPRDEGRHPPANDSNWVEVWQFDAVQADGSIALAIEFMLWPQHKRVAFHASVIRAGEPLISLVELEAPAPKHPSLEVRAPGLWTEVGIQTPLEHMTVDIEAFAVALDEAGDVFAGAYGIRTALGCELEWETAEQTGEAPSGAGARSYALPCIVHGELLIDEQTIEIDGWGWRTHRWGSPSASDRAPMLGRTGDGTWICEPNEDRALTMEVAGVAPVPDPSLDAQLWQYYAQNESGDRAWIRRLQP